MKLKYALLIAALTLAALSAFADTVINHIPYKIAAPGNYSLLVNYTGSAGTLGRDLNSGAIEINANNVVLDLNGANIVAPFIAIFSNSTSNITIKNGSLTANALTSELIFVKNAVNVSIQNVQMNAIGAGIGGTYNGNGAGSQGSATAITGYYNNGFTITNNLISQIGLGLWLWQCDGGVVAENVINKAIARAVVSTGSSNGNNLFKDNVINGGNSDGIVMNFGGGPGEQYVGNAILGLPGDTTPYEGGTNIAGQ
jgi:hypothetical protein